MMKYIVDGVEMEDIEEVLNYLEDNFDSEYFDEYLDQSYPDYYVGGSYYTASDILSNCDPVSYRCLLSDYTNNERETWEGAIEFMSDGDTCSIVGCDIECIEELYSCPVCGAEYDAEEEAEECCCEDEEE